MTIGRAVARMGFFNGLLDLAVPNAGRRTRERLKWAGV